MSEPTEQNIWDERFLGVERQLETDRLRQYEQILGQAATGVFILEPRRPGELGDLEVALVNEMGARFFGQVDANGLQVLAEAKH